MKLKKKKETTPTKLVENILDSFKNNLHGVEFYFNKFGGIAEIEDKDAKTNAIDFIKRAFENVGIDIDSPEKNDDKSIKFSNEELYELARGLRKKPNLSSQNFQILSSSSFLMLNNYFEYLIADLLSYHYNKYKNTLNSKEFKVSLKEIDEYENIQELEKSLILKEVEGMLVELSFDSLLNHFKEKLNIDLNSDIINWDLINESRERRHLIVHNSSLVNKKYLSRTNNPEKKKVGDKIDVDKEYFQKIFNEIKLAGLLLSYNCWGSWDSENATEAIQNMLDESFESLQNNNYDFSLKVTTYIDKIEPRDEDQEDYLLRARFNKCISLKKLNKKTELNRTLKKIKVGTCSPLFKLAHSILSDKKEEVILELIEQSYKLNEIEIDDYLDWPLFNFIREKDELHTKILERFKKLEPTIGIKNC